MEARQINNAGYELVDKHDLSIIQGELRDIKELLASILKILSVPIPTSIAIDGSPIYPVGPLPPAHETANTP